MPYSTSLHQRCFQKHLPGLHPALVSLCCDQGGSLVELALILSIFLPLLLLGTAEVGTFVYYSVEVSNAAHAGAMYGMSSSGASADASGIRAAAQAEASDLGSNLNVTSSYYWACSAAQGGTQYTSETDASAACPTSNQSNHKLEFVKVAVSAAVTPVIHCPGLPATLTLNSTSVMEVQE
jgi:Flp pilus assembly protein TadG